MRDTFVRPGRRAVLPDPRPVRVHHEFCPSGLRPGALECWCLLYDRPKTALQRELDLERYTKKETTQ